MHDKDQLTKSLHLASINLILTSILHDRQSSTAREDLELFARSVSESQIVEDEKAMNKPMFQLVDKFSLFGAEYFDIQHMFTMMLSQSLDFYFAQNDMRKLQDFQKYILTYSI